MRNIYVATLEKCEKSLARDLVYDDIAPKLIQNRLVSIEEHQNIVDLPTEASKVRQLIETLASKRDDAFNNLVRILCKDYNWLAEALLEASSHDETDLAVPSTSKAKDKCCRVDDDVEQTRKRKSSDEGEVKKRRAGKGGHPIQDTRSMVGDNPQEDIDDQAITNDMITIVRRNYRVSKSWTSLAHSLGLSSHIHNIRVKVNTYVEAEDMCVVYLLQEWLGLRPKAATLLNLLRVLRNDSFNDVADELEEKYIPGH